MQGIIVLNKQQGFTSMDCCAIIRKICHEKRVGHTGTLDPNATGVLPICVGKATRLIEYMDFGSKTYTAEFKLGYTSDTEDIWGDVKQVPYETISETDVQRALCSFIGDIEQIPPMYSAKKINGQRLYDLARSGQQVERKAQNIHIYNADLLSFDGITGKIKIECSRGTYIRTICSDLGKKLGTDAVMSSLVRNSAAGYSLEDAIDIDELRDNPNLISDIIRPLESAVSGMNHISIDQRTLKLFINGNSSLDFGTNELSAVFYKEKLIGIVKDNKIQKVFNDNI